MDRLKKGALIIIVMRPPVKITFPAFLDKEACFATVLDKRENPFYFMEGGVDGSHWTPSGRVACGSVPHNGEGIRRWLVVDLGSWEANGGAHAWWR